MDPHTEFIAEREMRIRSYKDDQPFQALSQSWLLESMRRKYAYNFTWLGRPVIQNPADLIAMQEILWQVKPDLIIETGVAHGGSLLFYSSILELNAAAGGPTHAAVLGVDIDIRAHNRQAIQDHPFSSRVHLLQGSSVEDTLIERVREFASNYKRILVCLDSNHTHEHVIRELELYAPLVTVGSYCVVFDTFVEDMPKNLFADRPWGPGDNPKTAVHEFLKRDTDFEIDTEFPAKLMITVAPDGFLKRVR